MQRGGGEQGCARGAQRQSLCAVSAGRDPGTPCRALKPGDASPGWAKLAARAAPSYVQAQRADALSADAPWCLSSECTSSGPEGGTTAPQLACGRW